MKVLKLPIAEGQRWDESVQRAFAENLPYRLTGARAVASGERELELHLPDELDMDVAKREADALLSTVVAGLRDGRERVLREHNPATVMARLDPMAALVAKGEVRFTGRGRAVYGGCTKLLVDTLDVWLARLAMARGAVAQNYPTTVDRNSMVRAGYLRAFPHHAMFVAATAENSGSLNTVAATAAGVDIAAGALGPHDQVLAPTICYHCFESLKDSPMAAASLYTAVGSCHRFEILAGASLDRLQTYRMREAIIFDNAKQVTDTLDSFLEATELALTRWNVPYRVATAMDPFFIGALGTKAYFQSVFELKRELQVRLDFSGRWIAIASFNHHQQSLTQAFGIAGLDGKLESGCVGWGLERFAYVLLAQFGTDPGQWPEAMRADLAI
jgi:seryl-tRNA synthetase